jgi:hypothetical protein
MFGSSKFIIDKISTSTVADNATIAIENLNQIFVIIWTTYLAKMHLAAC